MTVLRSGETGAREVSKRIAAHVANIAALEAVNASDCADGQIAITDADNKLWRFMASSAVAGDHQLVLAPATGSGRWLLASDVATLALPIGFGTADAAILYTIPTGAYILPLDFFWGITADFTGGASSAIGISSSTKAGATTKGDLLGGASGDLAATLVASAVKAFGTVGATWATIANRRKLWVPTDTFRFDRITSVFAAGAGTANVVAAILQNAGA